MKVVTHTTFIIPFWQAVIGITLVFALAVLIYWFMTGNKD